MHDITDTVKWILYLESLEGCVRDGKMTEAQARVVRDLWSSAKEREPMLRYPAAIAGGEGYTLAWCYRAQTQSLSVTIEDDGKVCWFFRDNASNVSEGSEEAEQTIPEAVYERLHWFKEKLAPNTFCSFCGSRLGQFEGTELKCTACSHATYLNATCVAVVIQPVDDGIIVIQRKLPGEGHGEYALPGGYVMKDESWQEAAAREANEEAALVIDPKQIMHLQTVSAPNGIVLIFGVAPHLDSKGLPTFTDNSEVYSRAIFAPDCGLKIGFSLHAAAIDQFFATCLR